MLSAVCAASWAGLGTPVAASASTAHLEITGMVTVQVNPPLDQDGQPRHFASVDCPTTADCYAAAGTGTVDSTSNYGKSWSAHAVVTYPTPAPQVELSFVRAIDCPTSANCYAVVDSGGGEGWVAVSRDSGRSWADKNSFSFLYPNNIDCPSASVCYVTSNSQRAEGKAPHRIEAETAMTVTTDGGRSWKEEQLGPALGYTLWGVYCLSNTTCFAAGGEGNDGLFARTTDGGAHWQTWRSLGQWSGSITCVSATSCLAAKGAEFLATSDGGATWEAQPLPPGISSVAQVMCASAKVCWAVATTSYVMPRSVLLADLGQGWLRSPCR